jgi:hypothetical protein
MRDGVINLEKQRKREAESNPKFNGDARQWRDIVEISHIYENELIPFIVRVRGLFAFRRVRESAGGVGYTGAVGNDAGRFEIVFRQPGAGRGNGEWG